MRSPVCLTGPGLGPTQIEFDALVVGLARVDPLQDRAVSLNELRRVHGGKEVQFVIRVVSVTRIQDPSLLAQTPKELSPWHGLQKPHHGYRDAAFLDKLHHPVKNVLAICIESKDESSHHLHSIALDLGHAVEQAAPSILQLVGRDQTGFIRSLNAQKDRDKAGVSHQPHQLRVVGEVE